MTHDPKPVGASRSRQRDIARLAGVAQSTVSVVLSGNAGQRAISAETTEKVLAAAHRLGYRPDIAAQRMRGMNSRMIGIHTYGDLFPISAHNYNHEYLLGIQLAAEQARYDMVLFTSTIHSSAGPTAYLDDTNRLAAADGAVVMGFRSDHDELARLTAEGYPFVRIGRRDVDGLDIAWVDADLASGAADLVAQLRAAGHESLLYVGSARNTTESQLDRRAGITAASEMGKDIPQVFVERHEIDPDWLRDTLAAGHHTLVAEHHQIAMRISQAATDLGIKLGDDLAIAVAQAPFKDVSESGYCGYLMEPRVEIGRAAAELLIDLIDGTGGLPRRSRITASAFVTKRSITRPAV